MRERPREFKFFALVLMAIALSFPIQVMLAYGQPLTEIRSAIESLAPLNWVVIGLAFMNAFLAIRASTYLYVTTPLFLVAVMWNNWLVVQIGLNAPAWSGVAASLGALAVHGFILTPAARRVLLNPRLRWWNTPFRKRASVRALIRPVTGNDELRTFTFDLSTGGAFIQLTDGTSTNSRSSPYRQLRVGARCSVRLMLDQLNVISCGAEVVRQTDARGGYPAGVALRFVSLEPDQRRALDSYVRSATA